MGSVTHSAVVVVPDDPAFPVGSDEWNDGHVVTLTAADVGADASGAAAAAQAASQPLDADLTAIAALSTTSFGRSHLTEADAAAGRTLLGLGTLATQSGTFSGTSSGTNTGDQTSVSGNAGTATALQTARAINGVNFDGTAAITVSAAPSGSAGGGLTGTYPNPTVATNANLTGDVTSSGNATTYAGTVPINKGGTNATSASAAATNLGLGTGDSPQFAGVNVGNATDTTITRVSGGVIAVEGATVVVQGGALGTPASGVATNLTGTAASLTAGTVTTNANLTGDVTSVGNATTLATVTVAKGGTNATTAAAARQNLATYGGLPFRSGGTFFYAPAFSATANAAFAQSTLFAMPFYVPVTTTFDKISVVCVTGAGSSSVRLGIYSDTAGVPDALVLDAGTVATTSSGINASITISQALTGGTWYWLACVSQGGAPTLQGCSGNNNNPVLGVPTLNPFSNGPMHGYSQASVTAGLPSPWGATATQAQALPIVWVNPH